MDPSQDFKSLQENIQSSLVATTRTVNGLANEDLSFQRTVDPSTGSRLDSANERLLRLAGDLLKSAAQFTGQMVPSIEDTDDVDIGWRSIVDVLDSLLEKSDTCLDEYTGLIKRKDAPTAADASRNTKKPKTSDKLDWSLKRANIIKPQNAFERKPNNFDNGPWKPLLSTKPHSKVPLEQSLDTFTDEQSHAQYRHPYETEIRSLQYPSRVYEKAEPVSYLPAETTSATWVDTYDGVLKMLGELKQAKEVAVDLEHHDYRSYPGLLSLMQISTRDKDWIIDTLQPWRHKLEILNEVFADPSIVKVFHGAFMDIIWLQRDLGLYVVGLFDTHYACDALGYAGKSLAYLLKRFADFDADKKYQMADWRIRPLPEEMLFYARSDTHYLLYIYDMVRNELVDRSVRGDPEQDLVERVVRKSKDVSLQRYESPNSDPETGHGPRGWFNTLAKSPSLLSSEQFSVYKAVHKWRDELARQHDESPAFIMPQHVLADIARLMPDDQKALWSLLQRDSQTVKTRLDELLALIREAKARGVNGPTMMDHFRCQSVGAVAPKASGDARAREGREDQETPDAKELRSERSQLWGAVPLSSVWDASDPAPDISGRTEFALPWTHYVQNAAMNDVTISEADGQAEAVLAPAKDESEPAAADDEGFTLKTGRKRSIGEAVTESDSDADSDADSSAAVGEDETSGGGAERSRPKADEEDLVKATRRKAKKERRKADKEAKKAELRAQKATRKQARKAAKAAAAQDTEAGAPKESDDEPFDYSKAQSVLHAKRANVSETRPSKAFDPYGLKTGDAPRGARSLNYQRAGKTATFKK